MYRTISDFSKAWSYETEATLKVLRSLRDEALAVKASPEGRTLGGVAWHLVGALGEIMNRAGLSDLPGLDTPQPASAAEFAPAYEQAARSLHTQVVEKWSDETLTEEVDMWGESWQRGFVLMFLLLHQAHHRGQATTMMRLADLRVPGVYGPTREEWVEMGMSPLD